MSIRVASRAAASSLAVAVVAASCGGPRPGGAAVAATTVPADSQDQQALFGGETLVVDDDRRDCHGARFTSIQDAVDAADDGDTIRVCPGRYLEAVAVLKTLRIVGSQRGKDARTRGIHNDDENARLEIWESDHRDIRITGNRFEHGGFILVRGTVGFEEGSPPTAVLIAGNRVAGAAHELFSAIEVESARQVRITDNVVRHGNRHGIRVGGEVSDVEVAGNRVKGFPGAGIMLEGAGGAAVADGQPVPVVVRGIVGGSANANELGRDDSIFHLQGVLDEVRAYGRELDAEEVQALLAECR